VPLYTVYSFGEAAIELQLRLGGRTDSSQGVPFINRCYNWLNQAQLLIARAPVAMSDLDSTTATLPLVQGINQYMRGQTLPPMTDMIGIVSVRIQGPTNFRMRRMPFIEYRALSQYATGQPARWTRRGNILAFDAFPDNQGPYTVLYDYRARPIQNTVSIDAEYQDAWIQIAKYLGWSALDQEAKAKTALSELPNLWQQWVQQPLDEEQWEAMNDPDLVIAPMGWDRGWYYIS